MGKKGNGTSARGASEAKGRALVLDAGALIAFERFEDQIDAFLDEAIATGEEIVIPTSAFAQVWRGGSRSARLARLMAGSWCDALDEARAREVGERLGRRDQTDVADAHVVCCALERDAELITSDPDHMEALIDAGESLVFVSV
jgi:hypothetical protein